MIGAARGPVIARQLVAVPMTLTRLASEGNLEWIIPANIVGSTIGFIIDGARGNQGPGSALLGGAGIRITGTLDFVSAGRSPGQTLWLIPGNGAVAGQQAGSTPGGGNGGAQGSGAGVGGGGGGYSAIGLSTTKTDALVLAGAGGGGSNNPGGAAPATIDTQVTTPTNAGNGATAGFLGWGGGGGGGGWRGGGGGGNQSGGAGGTSLAHSVHTSDVSAPGGWAGGRVIINWTELV